VPISHKLTSMHSLISKMKFVLQLVLMTIVAVNYATGDCAAEDSALTGLGEPAAPGSLAHPSRIMPNSSSNPAVQTPSVTTAPMSTPFKEDRSGIFLRPRIEQTVVSKPFTLKGAVEYAQQYYPNVLKSQSEVRAAKRNVTIQKINEYMPDSLFQYQEILASHNKLSQVFFGSPVFPAISGPATGSTAMDPYFFTAGGVSLDWAPLDFGLHKARIQLAKTLAEQSKAQYASTQLDVGLTAANAFLDAVIAFEQVRAAEQNVTSFVQFNEIVHAQVMASLKPGADESLSEAQLANARNDLIRAQLSRDLAYANLADAMGLGGKTIEVVVKGLSETAEPAQIQKSSPVFEQVPILQAANSVLTSAIAQ